MSTDLIVEGGYGSEAQGLQIELLRSPYDPQSGVWVTLNRYTDAREEQRQLLIKRTKQRAISWMAEKPADQIPRAFWQRLVEAALNAGHCEWDNMA